MARIDIANYKCDRKERDDDEPPFRACVKLELDFDLADALGELILDSDTRNGALLALAHRITGR